jgi:hypothetical protein
MSNHLTDLFLPPNQPERQISHRLTIESETALWEAKPDPGRMSAIRKFPCDDLDAIDLIELVDLGCQNEIALRQPVDFVCPARNLHFSPSKEHLRVMALRLRKLANAVHEREGLAKVGKLKSFCDVMFFDNVPIVDLRFEGGKILAFEWGNTSTTRNAGFA